MGVAPTDLPSNHSYHHGKLEQLETALRSSLPIIHSTNSNCPLCPGCSPLCGLLDELDATAPKFRKQITREKKKQGRALRRRRDQNKQRGVSSIHRSGPKHKISMSNVPLPE